MSDKKRKYIKIAKWIGGILLVIVVLAGAGAFYLSAKWKPTLTTKIKAGVYQSSKGLYRIDFKDIHLNLFSGNAVLDSVKLTVDTNVYNQLKAVKLAPAHIFNIKLEHLKLSRVGILTAYFKKKIKMNSIVLDHPSIDMIYHKVAKRPDTVANDSTLYQQISKSIRSIRIGTINVVDADFDYYNGKKKLNAVKHLTINVKNVLIDSLSQFDTTRVLYSKDIGFAMSGYQSMTSDKMYTIKVNTVRGSISQRTLIVKGIKLVPNYPDLTFSRKYKVQKDRYNLSFNEISLKGIDFIGLHNDGALHAKHISIGAAKVAVFLNRELPPPNFDKGRNYPHNALKRLPIPTFIDTVSLHKVDVAYTEFNPKTNERGTVRLENLSGNLLNITNDSAQLVRKSHAYADLTTYIMGTGRLNVKIDFNLIAKNAAFSYVGHIGPMNMQVLNPLSKSLGQVEIKSGQVQKADFVVNATETGSSGKVTLYYNDLKINLLGEDENGKAKKKGLLSFLANTILIKNDNPEKGDPVRTANVSLERLPQASFFNLMWKTVFIGIRENVGIGKVPVKPMAPTKSSKNELMQERKEEKKLEKPKAKKQ
jgi:hypothetical protein